jgi:hypothetical protein
VSIENKLEALGKPVSSIRHLILLGLLLITIISYGLTVDNLARGSVQHTEFIDTVKSQNGRILRNTIIADSALNTILKKISTDQEVNHKLLCSIAKNPIALCN